MSPTAIRPEITAFAAAVRAHLDDLPAEDVDELVGGLEADLSDQAAESGEDFTFPDAVAYAAELRAAAGLPERTTKKPERVSVMDRSAQAAKRAVTAVRANPLGAWVLETLLALRPVWWVVRGAAFYLFGIFLLNAFLIWTPYFTTQPLAWLVGAALVVVSVQWGRGRWTPRTWVRVAAAIANVVAIVTTIVAITQIPLLIARATNDSAHYYTEPFTPGLSVDGERVRNIFAYDAEGNPIDRVQLFDQDGRPLTTVRRDVGNEQVDYYFFGGGGPAPVGLIENGRRPIWNVFPLSELPAEIGWSDQDIDPDEAKTPSFPFGQVPAVSNKLGPSASPSSPSTAEEVPVPTPSAVP